MFTTNPWSVYVYTAGPLIAGYYLFVASRFYGGEIKARINQWARRSPKRARADQEVIRDERDQEPVQKGSIQTLSQAQSAGQTNLVSLQENKHTPAGHHDLPAHITGLIAEAHEKDYDKQELILLLQMTIKDYLDSQGTQLRSAISELISNECAKYGSIHLGEKDKEAIWDKV